MKKPQLLTATAIATIVAFSAVAQTSPQTVSKGQEENGLAVLSHMSLAPPTATPPTATPPTVTPQATVSPLQNTPSSSPLSPPVLRPSFVTQSAPFSGSPTETETAASGSTAASPPQQQLQLSGALAQVAPAQATMRPGIQYPVGQSQVNQSQVGQSQVNQSQVGQSQVGQGGDGMPFIAQTSDPFATHVPELPPILRIFEENNIRITSLGGEGGLRGYLLEEPAGRMQVVYLTPDGKSLVVGVMQTISNDGKHLENVTMLQFAEMRQRFEAAQHAIEEQKRKADEERRHADEATASLEQQQSRIREASRQFDAPVVGQNSPAPVSVGAPAGQPTGAPTERAAQATAPLAQNPPASLPAASSALHTPLPSAGDAGNAPNQATPVAPRTMSMLPGVDGHDLGGQGTGERKDNGREYATNIDKGKFLAELERTAYFPVGKEGAPTIYMVADPQCPHCHATWAYLKPLVAQGKIMVKVILVAALPGSDRVALSLLSQPNPGRAWWDGEGSESGHPVLPGGTSGSQAERNGQKYLDINMQFLRAHKIDGTPWMGYVGNDGKVYQMEGDQDVPAFLSNMKGM